MIGKVLNYLTLPWKYASKLCVYDAKMFDTYDAKKGWKINFKWNEKTSSNTTTKDDSIPLMYPLYSRIMPMATLLNW